MRISEDEMKYLRLLASEYDTAEEAAAEIINLTAIQNLPKGTEHFLSDIHGEYEAFQHILRNASGTLKIKIEEIFPELPEADRKVLATLIYYPEEKLALIKKVTPNMPAFYRDTIFRLVRLLQEITFKYTRSYVQKQTPGKYSYILQELLYGDDIKSANDVSYKENIVESIIEIGSADDFIKSICTMITRMAIFKLHILGDVYDRGAGGDVVLETLMHQQTVDIQWGNHDILWMGAAAGNKACIANVIRICTRYDNLHTLEVGYGISLRPLVTFAMNTYGNDPCPNFKAIASTRDAMYDADIESLSKISKAIAVMQFKLEGKIIKNHPHYDMDDRLLLDKINFETNTVTVEGKEYPMNNTFFPTIDPADPYALTDEEEAVMDRLQRAFLESEALQRHVRWLFAKGSIYKVVNGNLLYHGCVPLTKEGKLDYMPTADGHKKGKEWFDYAERLVRTGYFGKPGTRVKERGVDFFWYLWCGYKSPLFGKRKMTTFERLFIEDEETWKEPKNPYYKYQDDLKSVEMILKEFDANVEEGVIINGHMPVKKGTSPMHCDGRVITIDGGFAKAYQKTTGIAGYSLIQNSYGFVLTANEPFESRAKAVANETDILSSQVAKENISKRMLNKDTDDGREMQAKIDGLKRLLEAYRQGYIKQAVD